MEAKFFLKQQIKKLTEKYPFITVKYYFDRFDNDHFVCLPSSELNKILLKEAKIIQKEFIQRFPHQLLSFIEIDEELDFDELVYEKKIEVLELNQLNQRNLETFSVKDRNDFAFIENIAEINIEKSNKLSTIAFELEEEYAFAA